MAFVTQNMRAPMAVRPTPQAPRTPRPATGRPLPFSVLLVSSAALALAFTWMVSGSIKSPAAGRTPAPVATQLR
jgi:hypothetical protein